MGTWKTRGLRGSALEDLINYTNDIYEEKHLALIQKIPTPITPIEMDKGKGQISLAYFDRKSTVDYIGAVQGIPVCFDAKECAADTFPMINVHEHQIRFMKEFERQGGIAFLIIQYTARDEIFYMPYRHLEVFWNRMKDGGRKSFRYEEVDKSYSVRRTGEAPVHYLEQLQHDLDERANNTENQ